MSNGNGAAIRRLTKGSLHSNRKRNLFIVAAIALTTLLLGSVFSIGMSLLESVQREELRYMGTSAHAAVGHPTPEQLEKLRGLDYVRLVGTGNNVGYVKNPPGLENISLTLHYFDKTEWEKLRSPAYFDLVGSYPQKEEEIMISRGMLERMGITDPKIGMEIPLTYSMDGGGNELIEESFRLSGWFSNYQLLMSMNRADTLLVSEALSQKLGRTLAEDGSATVLFDDDSRVLEYCESLRTDLGLSDSQPVLPVNRYEREEGAELSGMLALAAVIAFLCFTGYLLIYNVLYISVSRDVRFYGLLKTLGTTPRQIRRIVMGQILRLCAVGIPLGSLLAAGLSLVAVPGLIEKMGATSGSATVSFSPVIYLGAAFFALLTALLGAMKPARKAAGSSPIEAQRYTGLEQGGGGVRRSAGGKPWRMALRNVFRDKKRAAVVLLSLTLGVTTFLTVTSLVSSMSVDGYINSMFDSDFVLRSNSQFSARGAEQDFDEAFLGELRSLPGLEEMSMTTREWMRMDYSKEAFGEYVADFFRRNGEELPSEEDIGRSFAGFIVGLGRKDVEKLNKTLEVPIDADAFLRGEFALAAVDDPSLLPTNELTLHPQRWGEEGFVPAAGNEGITMPIGGFVPFGYKMIGSGLAPTVFVSNTLMEELYGEPTLSEIGLDVAEGYDRQVLDALKQLTEGRHTVSLSSKLESMEELKNAKLALYVLGGGMALVIALIGILNFVNVMSVGIMVRRHELATLESVGMSKKQTRRLLIGEGLGYALLTLLLVYTAGSALTYGIFTLFRQQATYAVFTYPVLPLALVSLAILTVCVITPELSYRSLSRATLVERLREAE